MCQKVVFAFSTITLYFLCNRKKMTAFTLCKLWFVISEADSRRKMFTEMSVSVQTTVNRASCTVSPHFKTVFFLQLSKYESPFTWEVISEVVECTLKTGVYVLGLVLWLVVVEAPEVSWTVSQFDWEQRKDKRFAKNWRGVCHIMSSKGAHGADGAAAGFSPAYCTRHCFYS